jgi:hypothetical protein
VIDISILSHTTARCLLFFYLVSWCVASKPRQKSLRLTTPCGASFSSDAHLDSTASCPFVA